MQRRLRLRLLEGVAGRTFEKLLPCNIIPDALHPGELLPPFFTAPKAIASAKAFHGSVFHGVVPCIYSRAINIRGRIASRSPLNNGRYLLVQRIIQSFNLTD